MRFEIISTGDKVTRKLLKDFKEHLKESLPQIEILITTQAVQVI